ncbi:hypothetical protein RBG61_05380 [Paludicola sp. MB14-C6]|nr:hypothetical protein [Paludicola sp. MB14-C6]WMJ24096.1 hypothetical protein RBG61_05380 [Paludicola sp. MB14-C6]
MIEDLICGIIILTLSILITYMIEKRKKYYQKKHMQESQKCEREETNK